MLLITVKRRQSKSSINDYFGNKKKRKGVPYYEFAEFLKDRLEFKVISDSQRSDRLKKKAVKDITRWHFRICEIYLSVTDTSVSKLMQMAQQHKHCAFLPCTHAMKKKAFLLSAENQLVWREKIKGWTSQKSLIIQYQNDLFSMKCCRKLIRKACKYMQHCSRCELKLFSIEII